MQTHNFPAYNLQDLYAHSESQKRGLLFSLEVTWETIKPNLGNLIRTRFNVLGENQSNTSSSIFIDLGDTIFWVDSNKNNARISLSAYAKSKELLENCLKQVKAILPEAPEPIDSDISVRFWYLTNNGPTAVHRNISAPTWEKLSTNYATVTKNALNHLMDDFTPTSGGKLILWHGEPGTGKTYALRALCQAWKSWCSSEYIMDPETLLGGSPGYLASMVMESTSNLASLDDDDDDEVENRKWKLLIMEDTGELLTEHAKERSGQGLSRLLNVVDGFIGQGLKILVLITTNEEFQSLHPAVSREGRCLASIKFNHLNINEAQKFLKNNNASTSETLDKHKLYSLASLYGMINNSSMPRNVLWKEGDSSFGFKLSSN